MPIAEPSIAELAARAAITDVIHHYCRGLDRMDRALTLSCWHPGGTDDHAPLYSGTAEGFVDWLWPVHGAMAATRHVVSNILIDLDLPHDRAGAETYWSLVLRVPRGDELFDIVAGGRYLDRFERVDGRWAIRHRTSIGDVNRVEAVRDTLADVTPPLIAPHGPGAEPPTWARDRSDHSYQVVGGLGSDD